MSHNAEPITPQDWHRIQVPIHTFSNGDAVHVPSARSLFSRSTCISSWKLITAPRIMNLSSLWHMRKSKFVLEIKSRHVRSGDRGGHIDQSTCWGKMDPAVRMRQGAVLLEQGVKGEVAACPDTGLQSTFPQQRRSHP